MKKMGHNYGRSWSVAFFGAQPDPPDSFVANARSGQKDIWLS